MNFARMGRPALHALEQRITHLRENLRTNALRDEFEQANKFRRE
jgi:prephenate dehydrogenase